MSFLARSIAVFLWKIIPLNFFLNVDFRFHRTNRKIFRRKCERSWKLNKTCNNYTSAHVECRFDSTSFFKEAQKNHKSFSKCSKNILLKFVGFLVSSSFDFRVPQKQKMTKQIPKCFCCNSSFYHSYMRKRAKRFLFAGRWTSFSSKPTGFISFISVSTTLYLRTNFQCKNHESLSLHWNADSPKSPKSILLATCPDIQGHI